MLGFPIPYPGELLYSTIARAGVHDGDTSPKQLLDLVFNNRKVIATVDLPSHIESIADQYPESLGLDAQVLIYRHTLWPIYAPFQPKTRSRRLTTWMRGQSKGAVHLASGIAASRVKAKASLYVCPICIEEQKEEYGEPYLLRQWQVPLVKYCHKHGPLHLTSIELNGEHRHAYLPVGSGTILDPLEITKSDEIFSQQIEKLLTRPLQNSLSLEQWTHFYSHLVHKFDLMNDRRIDHSALKTRVTQFWGEKWLVEAGLMPLESDASWLKAIIRKHRKSFSFAEHIVVIQAISHGILCINDAIRIAAKKSFSGASATAKTLITKPITLEFSEDQNEWQLLLEKTAPKAARRRNPALYARLYRNHYEWLMQIDERNRKDPEPVNQRVDWSQRDRSAARYLLHVCEMLAEDLNVPRLSKTFLIHQFKNRATIEKNLHRLPRCTAVLTLYSESIDEYQARRLARAYLSMKQNQQPIKRWSLLREAGLGDERITNTVIQLLRKILSDQT